LLLPPLLLLLLLLPACLLQAVVREKSTTDSKKLGVLVEGQRVRVVSSRQRDGVERCKVALPPGIKGERGWVSLVRVLSLCLSLSLCAPAQLRCCLAARCVWRCVTVETSAAAAASASASAASPAQPTPNQSNAVHSRVGLLSACTQAARDGTVLMVAEQEWAPSEGDEADRAWIECETL